MRVNYTRDQPLVTFCSCGFRAGNLAQLEDHLDEFPDDDSHEELARDGHLNSAD